MSTIEVNTIKPISGSSTITLGESGDTIALASGASQTLAAMTPAFAAKLSSAQSISSETATKIAFATEIFDSDSKYDTSNYRFTPGVAGKYFIFVRVGYQEHNTSSGSLTDQAGLFARIYKNGSSVADAGNHSSVSSLQSVISSTATVIVDLDADDYIEAYTLQQNNNSNNPANLLSNEAYNTFGGYKIIGA